MAEPPPGIPDPLALWRDWIAQSERQWNTLLNQAMGSDQYGQAVGRFMEVYVAMQRGLADVMARQLAALNIPTRADVLDLGQRLGAIEDRLARIETALSAPDAAVAGGAASRASLRPPRTRRPPGPPGAAPGAAS